MGSHSVTCHLLAALTFPPLPQPKLILDSATQEGCKAELTCWSLYPKLVCPPMTVTCLRNNRAVSWPGMDVLSLDKLYVQLLICWCNTCWWLAFRHVSLLIGGYVIQWYGILYSLILSDSSNLSSAQMVLFSSRGGCLGILNKSTVSGTKRGHLIFDYNSSIRWLILYNFCTNGNRNEYSTVTCNLLT